MESEAVVGYKKWLENWGKSEHTIRKYVSAVETFLDKYSEMTTKSVQDFLDDFDDPNTRSLYYFALKNFGKFLESQDVDVGVKWELIPHQWQDRGFKALTVDQFRKLLGACKDARERAMVLMAYDLGLRVGELCNLRWEHIDGEGFVDLERLKEGSHVKVPLSPTTLEALKEYKHEVNAQRVFPWTEQTVRRIVREVGRRAGLKVHFHQLRHSRATHLSEQGWNIEEVQELLGHKKLETTRRYVKVAESRIARKKQEADVL